ncbi:MAG: pyrimidine 5'-nucleotidase [Alphaproteobacteria bacterium]|jgi:putative hydrolase of the HAD superfamily|nr:pyrimidine 5'-nucleotidase [Alphaproteobacteria bacterium]
MSPSLRPGLERAEVWLFDLDNTLYPLDSGLAVRVSDRITDFIQALTGLERDAARVLQKGYLADYGLTLRGLMTHHGVDPDAFHAAINDVELSSLAPDPGLAAAIAALPGRKLIFTNADAVHTTRVLDRLQMSHLFEDVFHIARAGYEPKPSEIAYERLLAATGIDAGRTVFFEDSERNLAPAARLGMTTVLVGDQAAHPAAPFVAYRAPSLHAFLTAGASIEKSPP